LRGIRDGKHAPISLGFQSNATALKPCDSVRRTEAIEGTDERPTTSWVAAGKLAGIEAGVSDIAASTAGDSNFRKCAGAFFQNHHADMRRGLSSRNRSKETSRASADHDNLEMGIAEHAALTPKERPNAKKNAR
jgi:hypothetical protein